MICLLITTMNRSRLLRRSFERLTELTQPDEILVVDDGGSDDCLQVCEEFGARYLYTHNPGVTLCSHARNVGLRATEAEIVITSEPEIMFITDVIAQLLAAHATCPEKMISAGTVHHAQAENVLEPAQCETIVGWVAPYTALYKRDWLTEIGGWDEQFPGVWGFDDIDLLSRLRLSGHGQVIDTEIEVLHQWHSRNQTDQAINDAHFLEKSYHRGDPADLIANRGMQWGAIKTR